MDGDAWVQKIPDSNQAFKVSPWNRAYFRHAGIVKYQEVTTNKKHE